MAAIARDAAIDVAAFMPEDIFSGLYSFGSSVYPTVDIYDSKGLQVPTQRKVELALELEDKGYGSAEADAHAALQA